LFIATGRSRPSGLLKNETIFLPNYPFSQKPETSSGKTATTNQKLPFCCKRHPRKLKPKFA
jgi:hypothetical protein